MPVKKITALFLIAIVLSLCLILACSKEKNYFQQSDKTFPQPQIGFIPKHYICYRTNGTISIDGKLDEPVWKQAAWTDEFVDIEGDLKPKPPYRTRAKMLWDDLFLYIAAELEEPHVWATLQQRDTVIFYDNDFEVFIDPDGDTHQYYEFEINAFNTQWDLLLIKPYRDGGPAVNAWDIQGLQTAVFVDGTINQPDDIDQGWSVEIAMPWQVLKECANKSTPPNDGDCWRINFSRVEWQVEIKNRNYRKAINPETGKPFPESNWVWSPQGLINMHYPEMWGFVLFSEKVAGTGEDVFTLSPDEHIKWQLREIYYRQKTHQMNFGTFSDDLQRLGFVSEKFENKLSIQTTWNQFEAMWQEDDVRWFIDEQGRTWKGDAVAR